MKPFCDLLELNDEKTVCVVMDGLMNILSTAAQQGEAEQICQMIEECDGLDKIENLQTHENEQVYKKALAIITTFFAEEEVRTQSAGLILTQNILLDKNFFRIYF